MRKSDLIYRLKGLANREDWEITLLKAVTDESKEEVWETIHTRERRLVELRAQIKELEPK